MVHISNANISTSFSNEILFFRKRRFMKPVHWNRWKDWHMLRMGFLWRILGSLQVLEEWCPLHQRQYALNDGLLRPFHVRMLYKSIAQAAYERWQLHWNLGQAGNIMGQELYSIINFLLCKLQYQNFLLSEMWKLSSHYSLLPVLSTFIQQTLSKMENQEVNLNITQFQSFIH